VILRLKRQGFTILLVEQNLRFARKVADRHVVIENGKVADILNAADLDRNMSRVQSYLGV
jgi:branched-chain amino acid transport system ATP-binding protein